MARESCTRVEVRYAETDQMGVVHHAVYPVWFEVARTSLCRASGYHYAEIERLGYMLMVTGLTVDYRKPARYGDALDVSCRLSRLGSRGLTFSYEVQRGDSLLARGTSTHVWLQADSGRICRIPAELEGPFAALADRDSPDDRAGRS